MNEKAKQKCKETNLLIVNAWQSVLDTMREPLSSKEHLKLTEIKLILHEASDLLEKLDW